MLIRFRRADGALAGTKGAVCGQAQKRTFVTRHASVLVAGACHFHGVEMPIDRKMPSARTTVELASMVRAGLCPNGCGLMHDCEEDGQHCQKCDFMCDERPDQPPAITQ